MSGRRKRLVRALKKLSPKQVARRAAGMEARLAAWDDELARIRIEMECLDMRLAAWDKFLGWRRGPGGYSWYI